MAFQKRKPKPDNLFPPRNDSYDIDVLPRKPTLRSYSQLNKGIFNFQNVLKSLYGEDILHCIRHNRSYEAAIQRWDRNTLNRDLVDRSALSILGNTLFGPSLLRWIDIFFYVVLAEMHDSVKLLNTETSSEEDYQAAMAYKRLLLVKANELVEQMKLQPMRHCVSSAVSHNSNSKEKEKEKKKKKMMNVRAVGDASSDLPRSRTNTASQAIEAHPDCELAEFIVQCVEWDIDHLQNRWADRRSI